MLQRLTPAPFETRRVGDHIEATWAGWRKLKERPLAGLEPWALNRLDDLVALEQVSQQATNGTTLVHLDIRGDNVLLTDRQVWFVDWPWACLGAPWIDPLLFAFSVESQGGPAANDVFRRSRWADDADPDAVAATLGAAAGMLVHHSLLPPPPGLPTLRPFQAAQGRVGIQLAPRPDRLMTGGAAASGRRDNRPMRFAIFLPPFAEFAEPRRVVELSRRVERAGWDGLFFWDHMLAFPGMAVADPWVVMAAVAAVTLSRIRLGALVTPLPRRRPWVLSRQMATLDRLSARTVDRRHRAWRRWRGPNSVRSVRRWSR